MGPSEGVAGAPRAAQELALAMEPGSGELLIRDADEPYALESPTTISGDIDDATGAITGLDLATPDVSFEVPIEGLPFTADVTASFSPVTPGSGTGQLSPDGALHLETSVRVELHISVPEAGLVADCVASPVRLVLDSTEPYDEGTGVVPLVDADFSIPAVAETATCSDLVVERVNPVLAGAGHALELTLAGAMTIPTAGTTPSATTLVADPAEPVSLGEPVELTATVVSDDAQVTDAPTGNVRFVARDKVIGQASVESGTAVLEISTLRLGTHQVTAEYRGDDTYRPSTSEPVTVTVQADPVVEVDLPSHVNIDAAPVEFDVTVDNPSVGRAISNTRVDVTIKRYSVTGTSTDPLAPDDVVLEVRGPGGVWTPVTLSQVPAQPTTTLAGSLGPNGGRALAAGAVLTDRVRIAFPDGFPQTVIGALDVVFDVVEVDPGTGAIEKTLSSSTGRVELMRAGLIPTIVAVDDYFTEIRPMPVRQHGTIGTRVYVGPLVGFATYPSGTIGVAIDGQSVPFFATDPGDLTKPSPMSAPIKSDYGNNAVQIILPDWVGPGAHQVTFSYSGNAQFAPSSYTTAITVIEAAPGTTYLCEMPLLFENRRFTAQIRAEGRLPTTARSGASVPVEEFSLDLSGSLDSATYFAFDIVENRGTDKEITIDFGPHGTGSATDLTISPEEFPLFDNVTDVAVGLPDEQATLTITGAPGEVITPKIEKVTFSSPSSLGSPQVITCTPVGDPITFSPITIAGTTLAVDAPAVVRSDDEVTLTASTFPATATGTVRFSSGEEILDIVPVTDGKAISTLQLPEGTHVITARFFAGASAPSTTSNVVTVTVLPATECAAFAEEGSGAVVRLVYMELLGRCPDQAGFDHWTGRLDGGISAEAFARLIAGTREAVGMVVDDAYHTMLGRAPDPAGRSFWIGRLRANGRYDSLLAELGASGEFWAKSGSSNTGFVTRVYDRLLGRAPDAGGLDHWVGRLDAGTSRRALIRTLANLDEPLGRLVTEAYGEILGRSPGTSERGNGIAFLRSTGDRSALYAELIGRTEFATRAGTFPNPED